MKIDKASGQLPVSQTQRFFLQSWHSMVHEGSLDSHRVRCMNSRTVLRELIQLFPKKLSKIDEDIRRVLDETHEIMSADYALRGPLLIAGTDFETTLLALRQAKLGDVKETDRSLFSYYARDLLDLLDKNYRSAVLDNLQEALSAAPLPAELPAYFERIHGLVSDLLSDLIAEGWSFEALFSLREQVFRRKSPREAGVYDFTARFLLLRRILSGAKFNFRVIFSLDGFTRQDALPASLGSIQLQSDPPNLEVTDHDIRRYTTPGQGKIFATIEVNATDARTAGRDARETLDAVLDLIRFEFEKDRVSVAEKFISIRSGQQPRIFPLPKVIPNPRRNLEPVELHEFIASLGQVLSNDSLTSEARDRIKSAFRLYRTGLDIENVETKFVHWWTALEYLVRGDSSTGNIGSAVENSLAPVLVLDYVSKNLDSYRYALAACGAATCAHVSGGEPVDFHGMALPDVFDAWKQPHYQQQIEGQLGAYPLLQFKLSQFCKVLRSSADVLAILQAHEKRVRWHIQRLYRTRCDIVHSAERSINTSVLCANLEFYLKSLLSSLLASLAGNNRIESPKEFFDRQAHTCSMLIAELKTGRDTRLRQGLHAGPW